LIVLSEYGDIQRYVYQVAEDAGRKEFMLHLKGFPSALAVDSFRVVMLPSGSRRRRLASPPTRLSASIHAASFRALSSPLISSTVTGNFSLVVVLRFLGLGDLAIS
jgi:hypothetical protein